MSPSQPHLRTIEDVAERLSTLLQDMLKFPRTYAVTAIELEAVLFSTIHLYAEVTGKTKLFTTVLNEVRDSRTLEFGGFCREFHREMFPSLEMCYSDDSFQAVTNPYSQLLETLCD